MDNGFRDPGSARAEKDPKRPIEASSSPEYLARGIPSKFADSTFINKILKVYPIISPVGAITAVIPYNDNFRGDNGMRAETIEKCRQFGEMRMDLGVISNEPVSVSIEETVSMGLHHFVRAENYFRLNLSEPIDGHSGYRGYYVRLTFRVHRRGQSQPQHLSRRDGTTEASVWPCDSKPTQIPPTAVVARQQATFSCRRLSTVGEWSRKMKYRRGNSKNTKRRDRLARWGREGEPKQD